MRADFGPFQDQGQVNMGDRAAGFGNETSGLAQEPVGRHIAPGRITGGKMLTDVTGAERAQDGVGQGMQPDVGVGVTLQAGVVRDANATEH